MGYFAFLSVFVLVYYFHEPIGDRIRGSNKLTKRQLSKMLNDPAIVEQIAASIEQHKLNQESTEKLLEEAVLRLISDEQFAAKVYDRRLSELSDRR